jgi:glucokinase
MNLLIADIGGTNSRCAIASAGVIGAVTTLRNADHAGVAALLARYIDSLPAAGRPTVGAIAVAAPIRSDEVRMVNIGWRFSQRDLQRTLGLSALHCLNDFEALAWSLPRLGASDLVQIGGGHDVEATKAVLGPGTGLGVASLARVGRGWHALAGEGGHVTLGPQDEPEDKLVRAGRQRYGHCSAERLVSGPGLSFIHETLHGGPLLGAEEIGRRLGGGDGQAKATFEAFFRLLGTVAGDLALTVGAFGGVYVGGGIVPRYLPEISRSGFRQRFEAKGRYQDYMRAIPTWIITAQYPALRGLVAFAARC